MHAIAIALREGYISPPASDAAPRDDAEPDASAAGSATTCARPLTIVTGFAEVLAADRPITDGRPPRVRAAASDAAADEIRAMLDARSS